MEEQIKEVTNALFLIHFLFQANTIQEEKVYASTVLDHYYTNLIIDNRQLGPSSKLFISQSWHFKCMSFIYFPNCKSGI